jgi:hypothetical protein
MAIVMITPMMLARPAILAQTKDARMLIWSAEG